ncbi:molybdopterin molybdotransferase MoeA [Pedobacter sp. PWIIR3]
MISVDEARALVIDNVSPLSPIKVKLANAFGHTLACDVISTLDIPAFRQSSMDGYAFNFSNVSEELLVSGEMAAGTSTPLFISGQMATRIFTGGPLPEGADTVVMQEKVELISGKIKILDTQLKAGGNVREKGSEIKEGALAMQKGSYLSPAAVGFLAGIGIAELYVYPMPSVSIILTGNELQQPGKKLAYGEVYESNSFLLSAALKQGGITNIKILEAKDNLSAVTDALSKALTSSDVVLLTGGVSVGDYDFVVEATKLSDVTQCFHKVKQKPGKPLYFGKKENKLIFGLPGNPSSVLSCFYNYVLPALAILSNKENSVLEISASLTHDYGKPIGLTHFLKGYYKDGSATPLSAQESYQLSSFAKANCLIRLEANKDRFQTGDVVTVMLLPN